MVGYRRCYSEPRYRKKSVTEAYLLRDAQIRPNQHHLNAMPKVNSITSSKCRLLIDAHAVRPTSLFLIDIDFVRERVRGLRCYRWDVFFMCIGESDDLHCG